jgi:hypothetical protein
MGQDESWPIVDAAPEGVAEESRADAWAVPKITSGL